MSCWQIPSELGQRQVSMTARGSFILCLLLSRDAESACLDSKALGTSFTDNQISSTLRFQRLCILRAFNGFKGVSLEKH